jgi:TonB family protein
MWSAALSLSLRCAARLPFRYSHKKVKMMTRHLLRGPRFLLVFVLAAALLPFAVNPQESEPKPLKKVIPTYPEVFKGRGIYGAVHLKAVIDASGAVKSVDVLGGNPIFSEASVKAIKQWKYSASGAERTSNITVEFECCYNVKTTP